MAKQELESATQAVKEVGEGLDNLGREIAEFPIVTLMSSLKLEDALILLYANERNCRIETFWDGGFRAQLGDEANGFTWDSGIGWYDLDKLAEMLLAAANKQLPLDYSATYDIEMPEQTGC